MNKSLLTIILTCIHFWLSAQDAVTNNNKLMVNFWGSLYTLTNPSIISTNLVDQDPPTQYEILMKNYNKDDLLKLIREIENIRKTLQLDDWFYYQLIRRVSQNIIPKQQNYTGYTLIKYMLLQYSGFDTRAFYSKSKILLYINSKDTVYNIPVKTIGENNYVCLNYHDYNSNIDFDTEKFEKEIGKLKIAHPFSYKISKIPFFNPDSTIKKNISFQYKGKKEEYSFQINPHGQEYFKNYPVIDYRYHFSIPFSSNIESSLIEKLKSRLSKLSVQDGVSYLMEFTRSGFQFAPDKIIYGGEKRFSPEETLFAENSDCEDRSSLMFALLTRIYNLPMIVISYTDHVNLGIGFEKVYGKGIQFEGRTYTLCEPTPQRKNFKLGNMDMKTFKKGYEIAFAYIPSK